MRIVSVFDFCLHLCMLHLTVAHKCQGNKEKLTAKKKSSRRKRKARGKREKLTAKKEKLTAKKKSSRTEPHRAKSRRIIVMVETRTTSLGQNLLVEIKKRVF